MESLGQIRKKGKDIQINIFLYLVRGKGLAWKGNQAGFLTDAEEGFDYKELKEFQKSNNAKGKLPKGAERVELDNTRRLGIATLGSLKQHPRISSFRRFIEGWYLSYFTPDAARGLPLAGPQKHLNIHGDNLGNVVQFMEREYPERFQAVLDKTAKKIPGIDKIQTEKTKDRRLLLKFNDKGFEDPFYAQQMSDGTLKVFAYFATVRRP